MALHRKEHTPPEITTIIMSDEYGREVVTAPATDPNLFSYTYQRSLRERIIGEHIGPLLGSPHPINDTIPMSEDVIQQASGNTAKKGIITARRAPNLITSDQVTRGHETS